MRPEHRLSGPKKGLQRLAQVCRCAKKRQMTCKPATSSYHDIDLVRRAHASSQGVLGILAMYMRMYSTYIYIYNYIYIV